MDILANAGGPTRFAESRQIRVLKADGKVIKFDLTAYTEGLDAVLHQIFRLVTLFLSLRKLT